MNTPTQQTGGAPTQPPIDNNHVAPGCELFASRPPPKERKDPAILAEVERFYPANQFSETIRRIAYTIIERERAKNV